MNYEAITWFLFWFSLVLGIISWLSWGVSLDIGNDGKRQRKATYFCLITTLILGILAFGSI